MGVAVDVVVRCRRRPLGQHGQGGPQAGGLGDSGRQAIGPAIVEQGLQLVLGHDVEVRPEPGVEPAGVGGRQDRRVGGVEAGQLLERAGGLVDRVGARPR